MCIYYMSLERKPVNNRNLSLGRFGTWCQPFSSVRIDINYSRVLLYEQRLFLTIILMSMEVETGFNSVVRGITLNRTKIFIYKIIL